jgi:quercetin dioxygenase-like cupin family protein
MKSISMKSTLSVVAALLTLAIASSGQPSKPAQPTPSGTPGWIFPKGEPIDKAHFSAGEAWVHWILPAESVYNTQLASVTYEKGTRTKWHYHPAGQILIVTSGTAYYQEKDKPKQILAKGAVAKCPPGVHHWHGASPDAAMTLMAINPNMDKGAVQWLDKIVTDADYLK